MRRASVESIFSSRAAGARARPLLRSRSRHHMKYTQTPSREPGRPPPQRSPPSRTRPLPSISRKIEMHMAASQLVASSGRLSSELRQQIGSSPSGRPAYARPPRAFNSHRQELSLGLGSAEHAALAENPISRPSCLLLASNDISAGSVRRRQVLVLLIGMGPLAVAARSGAHANVPCNLSRSLPIPRF